MKGKKRIVGGEKKGGKYWLRKRKRIAETRD